MYCAYWICNDVSLSGTLTLLCHRLDMEVIKGCTIVVTMLVQATRAESSTSWSNSWLRLIKIFIYVTTASLPGRRWILQAAGEVSSSSWQARSIPVRKKIVTDWFPFTFAKFLVPVLWQNSLRGKRTAWGTQQQSRAHAKTWVADWDLSSCMDFAESLRYGSGFLPNELCL